MEVPAPDSGEAAATGKQGAGVGRVPVSPGRGRARGLGAGEDAKSSLAPAGGVARGGHGGGGARRARGGRGRGCLLSPGRAPFRFSRLARLFPLSCRSPLPPTPPTKIKPETSRRGWLSPLKRPLCGPRRAPSVEGLEIGGEGGAGRAEWPWPPRVFRPAARDRLCPPGSPQSTPGVRGPGWRWRAETALTRRELAVQWGGRQ